MYDYYELPISNMKMLPLYWKPEVLQKAKKGRCFIRHCQLNCLLSANLVWMLQSNTAGISSIPDKTDMWMSASEFPAMEK